jgi:hypothetical protein
MIGPKGEQFALPLTCAGAPARRPCRLWLMATVPADASGLVAMLGPEPTASSGSPWLARSEPTSCAVTPWRVSLSRWSRKLSPLRPNNNVSTGLRGLCPTGQ